MPRYRIWSHEHRAWWRPNHSGYTTNLNEAGWYSREEAADITLDVIPAGIEIAVREGGEITIHGKDGFDGAVSRLARREVREG